MGTKAKIEKYVQKWEAQGYPDGIPDQCPDVLWRENLAPCWKAVAFAILSNDLNLYSLGFSRPNSEWYHHYKKIEIESREP